MSYPDGCWSSHIEALAWAVARTTGPVVEMGAGYYSTPLLHGLCEAQGRELWTFEQDPEWMAKVRDTWESDTHHFNKDFPENFKPGLMFVDDASAWRAGNILWAKDHGAELVVCHDTEPAGREVYPGMQEALDGFVFSRRWTNFPAHTTVVSDTVPLWN